jgi:hypothetical protein
MPQSRSFPIFRHLINAITLLGLQLRHSAIHNSSLQLYQCQSTAVSDVTSRKLTSFIVVKDRSLQAMLLIVETDLPKGHRQLNDCERSVNAQELRRFTRVCMEIREDSSEVLFGTSEVLLVH